MAFKDLAEENTNADKISLDFVNAFLFPEDDQKLKDKEGNIEVSERVHLGWGTIRALAFEDVKLFAVRLPGIELLRRYANGESGDDWFDEIVRQSSKQTQICWTWYRAF